jgi:hypothetical protein
MDMIKDTKSGAVINKDKTTLNKYKLDRKYQRKVDKLEADIEEMQSFISAICERLNNLEQR